MVKIGFIGNIAAMQPYIQQIRKEDGFEIIGKSSVGMSEQSSLGPISVPEYVKTVLINESDAIIINNSELVSFDLVRDAIRKYKHLLFNDFPNFTPAQCLDLSKLVNEAGNIVQIKNHLLENPYISWIADQWQEPAYLNYFESTTKFEFKSFQLKKILLFAHSLFKSVPQKIRVSGIDNQQNSISFLNIRFDYPSFSALNFELLEHSSPDMRLKAVLPGKFIETDQKNNLIVNHEKVTDLPMKNEISRFLDNIRSGNITGSQGLHAYHQVLNTYEELMRKISLYSPWYINY